VKEEKSEDVQEKAEKEAMEVDAAGPIEGGEAIDAKANGNGKAKEKEVSKNVSTCNASILTDSRTHFTPN
jgi:hypothetical protein